METMNKDDIRKLEVKSHVITGYCSSGLRPGGVGEIEVQEEVLRELKQAYSLGFDRGKEGNKDE